VAVGYGGRPDPGRATDLAEFIGLLGDLRTWAGEPSYRALAKRVGPLLRPQQAVPPSTIIDVFKARRRRLNFDLVVGIVRALGLAEPEVAEWRAACVSVHAKAKTSTPVGGSRQLPPDLATFTGREGNLKQLLETAASGTSATVVISAVEGMAGVGKTQLAVHAAHQLVRAGHFADVALYANLRGFDPERSPIDPAVVLDGFLRALGVPGQEIPDDRDLRSAMFRDRMYGRNALILLDNAADEGQVRDLIPAGPSCMVLVTSRRSLAGLDGAVVHQLDVFSHVEALELLTRIVGAERVSAERSTAVEIVEACGLLPIAVTLVASRLRTRPSWKLADLAGFLREGGMDALGVGDRSLRHVFDLSFNGLSDSVQRMFCLLGLHPGTDISASAAAALADTTPVAARTLLELLQDEHLLQQGTSGRYEFHDLLRAYAVGRATSDISSDERDNAVRRVLAWYTVTADAAAQTIGSNGYDTAIPVSETGGYTAHFDSSVEVMDWFTREQANLLDAAELAADLALPYLAWRLPLAQTRFLFEVANWQTLEKAAYLALNASERGSCELSALAEILRQLGTAECNQGKFEESETHLSHALRIFQELGDCEKEVHATASLSWLYMKSGRPERGVEILNQAQSVIDQSGDRFPFAEYVIVNNIAACLHELNRPVDALEYLLNGIGKLQGNPRRWMALRNVGYTYLVLERFADAEEPFREAIGIARELGNHYYHVEMLHGVAKSLKGQGRTAEARECIAQSRQVFDHVGGLEAVGMRERLESSPLWFEE
jgi:tetratricopeptide (TPR) repeat protein